MSMPEITFITSHAKKAAEISRYLNYPVTNHKLDLPEIQSLDPAEVVTLKAREAYKRLKRPILVEDFSLRFEALGRLPGPLIKWFLSELEPEGLCKLLNNYSTRTAYARTCFALYDDSGIHIFDGEISGVITIAPSGEHGYGTDSIFIPNGQSKTWGEMDTKEQDIYSLRSIGLKKLQTYLHKQYFDTINV